jgi:hypothetical protein
VCFANSPVKFLQNIRWRKQMAQPCRWWTKRAISVACPLYASSNGDCPQQLSSKISVANFCLVAARDNMQKGPGKQHAACHSCSRHRI